LKEFFGSAKDEQLNKLMNLTLHEDSVMKAMKDALHKEKIKKMQKREKQNKAMSMVKLYGKARCLNS